MKYDMNEYKDKLSTLNMVQEDHIPYMTIRLPVVLTMEEVRQVLLRTNGVACIVIRLIYSSGLRLSEVLRLRVQDINLENKSITVRSGKGNKDRITILSSSIISDLQKQLGKSRELFENSVIPVSLPTALERKYPNANLE